MPGRAGRHARTSGRRSGLRWIAGVAGIAVTGTALGVGLAASPAGAAPKPRYHAGSDTATFTVTGVLDQNCLVSTGGTQVFIKPGDAIKFNSSLVGVDVAGLSVGAGSVAGLNVSAVIDANRAGEHSVRITGGRSVTVTGLSSGTHTLSWKATGVPLAGGLLGSLGTLPLSSSQLKAGASLSWAGRIYVTKNAPKCKIGVATPRADVSLGPVHVSVPSVDVGVPGVTVPKVLPPIPNLLPGKSAGSPAGGAKSGRTAATSALTARGPALTVPDMVVPNGDGGVIYGDSGGGYPGGVSGGGSQQLGSLTSVGGSGAPIAPVPGSSPAAVSGKKQAVDLASNNPDAGSGQLPVLLAIIAVIALAVVAGTYARMFLVRRT